MKKKIGPPAPGHVVKRVYDRDGKLLGSICDDDYRDLTPEQLEERKKQVRENCEKAWSEAIAGGRIKYPT